MITVKTRLGNLFYSRNKNKKCQIGLINATAQSWLPQGSLTLTNNNNNDIKICLSLSSFRPFYEDRQIGTTWDE